MRQIPKRRLLLPIYLLTFLDQVAITLCFPVLIFICFDKQSLFFSPNASHAIRSYWFGVLSAIPYLVSIIAAPLLGYLSDHYGRKKLLLVGACGIIFFAGFAAVSVLIGSFLLLIIGYIINGFCVRTEPIAAAAASDCSETADRFINLSYLQFYVSVGAIIGPFVGGYLIHHFLFQKLNFSSPYIASFFVGVLTVMVTLFVFNETRGVVEKHKGFLLFFREIINKKILYLVLLLFLTQIAWRIYYQFVPALLKISANYSGSDIGIFMGMVAVYLAIASSLGVKVLGYYFKQKQIFNICFYLMLVSVITILGVSCFHGSMQIKNILVWLSAASIAIGDVIIYSIISAELLNLGGKDNYGKMMGLNFIVVSITWTLTGLLGGVLFALNISLPFWLALLCLFVVFIIRNLSGPFRVGCVMDN